MSEPMKPRLSVGKIILGTVLALLTGALFPVLAIECAARPATNSWGSQRIWEGDPARVAQWAKAEWDRKGYRAR